MNKAILNHYLAFGAFTDPGCYQQILRDSLPDDIREIGLLIRKQVIHRLTLKNGNTGSNSDKKYGNMTKVPWYQQPEDDYFPTAGGMLTELYRRDSRGFVTDRKEENRLILTCRFVSILTVSILKSKGIPARCRAGYADYFRDTSGKSVDHWLNQYWLKEENRWVTIDVDGSIEGYLPFDPYDLPENTFDFPAIAWEAVRSGKAKGNHYWDAGGHDGLDSICWELFHDFHSLMNREVIYGHGPKYIKGRPFTKADLQELDELAFLMRQPDENFRKLKNIWETKRKFRILTGGLL